MSERYPFLELSEKLNADGRRTLAFEEARQHPAKFSSSTEREAVGAPMHIEGQIQSLYEASVTGVQSSFKHLSKHDIAYPPHRWFDAALARQIALHIMINRFDVPRRRLVAELQRSREAVTRAMRTVDERLLDEDFAETYEAMAEVACKSKEADKS